MAWEQEAKTTAMTAEEAARVPARPRGWGLGAAALWTVRRQAEAMKKKRVSAIGAANVRAPATENKPRSGVADRTKMAKASLYPVIRR